MNTDLDHAMQTYAEDKRKSAQYRTADELYALGWKYRGRDASGRRIIMTKENMTCRIDEDGQARR